MSATTVLERTPLYERTETLDKSLDEECRASVHWATQYGPAWATASPEPVRCAHGHWESGADGMPRPLRGAGSEAGLYMWHGPTGWHLTVAGPRGAIVTGSVMTDGIIDGVVPHFLSPAAVGIAPTDNGLRFRIKLADGTAGFDFRIGCGSNLVTTAFVGGRRLEPSEIVLGADGYHPEAVPFQVSRIAQVALVD